MSSVEESIAKFHPNTQVKFAQFVPYLKTQTADFQAEIVRGWGELDKSWRSRLAREARSVAQLAELDAAHSVRLASLPNGNMKVQLAGLATVALCVGGIGLIALGRGRPTWTDRVAQDGLRERQR